MIQVVFAVSLGMFFLLLPTKAYGTYDKNPSKGVGFSNEQIPFAEKLEGIFDQLRVTVENQLKEEIAITSLDKFLSSVVHTMNSKKGQTLESLGLDPKLIQSIGNLSQSKAQSVELSDLEKVLKNPSNLSQDEKAIILGRLLVKLRGGPATKATTQVIEDLLENQSLLAGDSSIELSEGSLKLLQIDKDKSPLSVLKAFKNIDLEKDTSQILFDLLKIAPLDPELLDISLRPIMKQFYEAARREEKSLVTRTPETFEEAKSLIEEWTNRRMAQFEKEAQIIPRNRTFEPAPIEPIEPKGCRGIVLPEPRFDGGLGNGSRFQGPRNFSGNGRSRRRGRQFVPNTPSLDGASNNVACLNTIKEKRFNVELTMPGSLCASTAVSIDPVRELAQINERSDGEFCDVDLSTAVHCVNSVRLRGRTIATKIGGRPISAFVTNVGRVDAASGTPVENGNPDLALLTVRIPCADAKKLNFARVPTSAQIEELKERAIPLVLQQNSDINASTNGENRATIAALGRFQFQQSDNGRAELGNFLQFNSNSRLNQSNGRFDSNLIKSGDSGGAALTCTENNSKLDVLYLGAISFVAVEGNRKEGRIGGIASGRSLLELGRVLRGNESSFADASGAILRQSGGRLQQHSNASQ